jgi:hypothetical protein
MLRRTELADGTENLTAPGIFLGGRSDHVWNETCIASSRRGSDSDSPSSSPSPPRAIQDKLLLTAIAESRKSRRNSVHYTVNAGVNLVRCDSLDHLGHRLEGSRRHRMERYLVAEPSAMRKLDPCENGWDIKLVPAMELIPVMISIWAG